MRIQTVSKEACAALVVMAVALCIPNAFSQGRPVVTQPRRTAPASLTGGGPSPTSNPVGRMTNPVQPIIQSPFMPHPATTPPVVRPNSSRVGRNAIVVPAYAPAPYYAEPYYYDYLRPVITIPGLLPGARYEDYRDTRFDDYRATSYRPDFDSAPASAPASPIVYYLPAPDPEQRWIIREPRPDRVIQPPAVGTSRADVIAQLGQPWGSIIIRRIETLYLDGITVVFGTDGRVTSTR